MTENTKENKFKHIITNISDKLIWKIIGLICIIELAAIFAQNYSAGCRDIPIHHFFEFFGNIYEKGVLTFMQYFSWAFLILLLFLIPSCMNNIKDLFENACKIVTKTSYFREETPKQQDEKDKETFDIIQTEQENIVKDDIAEETKSGDKHVNNSKKIESEFEKRMKIRQQLSGFVQEHTKKLNIDNFVLKSKVSVIDDPVSDNIKLLFDYSYRFKGNDRTRRYINTLIIPSSLRSADLYYRYIRIMNDINKAHKNQRFAVELVLLKLDNMKERTAYDSIVDIYAKAIDSGILVVKECGLGEDNKPKFLRQDGWVLDPPVYE